MVQENSSTPVLFLRERDFRLSFGPGRQIGRRNRSAMAKYRLKIFGLLETMEQRCRCSEIRMIFVLYSFRSLNCNHTGAPSWRTSARTDLARYLRILRKSTPSVGVAERKQISTGCEMVEGWETLKPTHTHTHITISSTHIRPLSSLPKLWSSIAKRAAQRNEIVTKGILLTP